MNVRSFLLPVVLPLTLLSVGCAPTDATSADGEPAEAAESELHANGRGVGGTDDKGYALNQPNVARELAASVAPSFVDGDLVNVPGVVTASSSTSPYAYAATLELPAWSSVSTTQPNYSAGTTMFVQVEGKLNTRTGKLAKALFDAMTQVPAVSENGALLRRSSRGSVRCYSYPDHAQCFLGPLSHVEAR